ncbi:MAG: FAD-dependent oxidoreductase [Vicinamibacteria bacterium]
MARAVTSPGRTLIAGAGPTGLGAAGRLGELGPHDLLVLEAGDGPGGLATSVVDAEGFTWDVGGHVQFSHYAYYDAVLDRALSDWLHHEREAWILFRGRLLPYPFQQNLHHLERADAEAALAGLETAAAARGGRPADFAAWIVDTFGPWIAEHFLLPYNRKVWGVPLERMGVGWMGERVAPPDAGSARRQLDERRDQVDWGPNRAFRFPARGGTGAIWRAVAALLPPDRIRYGARVAAVDATARTVTLATGDRLPFDTLVSTMPLDVLCASTTGLAGDARDAAAGLVKSAVHVVGVGLEGALPGALARKCWIYFPDPASPYYRVTVFSNYSPAHAPAGCWSLMAEVCETAHRPVDAARVADDVVAALRADGLVPAGARVRSLWHRREEHGYPTPFLERDAVLGRILPALEHHRIFSRGRFGAWTYEVSNQDHSFMQGVELADRLTGAGVEDTLRRPALVNGGAYRERPAQRV